MLLAPDALGTRTVRVTPGAIATTLARHGAVVHPERGGDAVVVDAAGRFRDGDIAGLRAALDDTWDEVRDHARATWIPDGSGGSVVLLGPRPAAGPHAEAARAGLENMARTLSIEWARYGIRPVAVLPGDDVEDDEVAELVAYLVSPAGDYFSGTALAPA